jgi:hypothetical protein
MQQDAPHKDKVWEQVVFRFMCGWHCFQEWLLTISITFCCCCHDSIYPLLFLVSSVLTSGLLSVVAVPARKWLWCSEGIGFLHIKSGNWDMLIAVYQTMSCYNVHWYENPKSSTFQYHEWFQNSTGALYSHVSHAGIFCSDINWCKSKVVPVRGLVGL